VAHAQGYGSWSSIRAWRSRSLIIISLLWYRQTATPGDTHSELHAEALCPFSAFCSVSFPCFGDLQDNHCGEPAHCLLVRAIPAKWLSVGSFTSRDSDFSLPPPIVNWLWNQSNLFCGVYMVRTSPWTGAYEPWIRPITSIQCEVLCPRSLYHAFMLYVIPKT
jgi:hypothetical protein